ncbi:MAG TPA: hypothetical protein VIY53_05495 [Acidobacteriaceae bacterium]
MGILDVDVPNQEEIAAVLENARGRLRLWARRTANATAALLLNCVAVWLFLDVGPWHAYWQPFGQVFLLLGMALLLVFVYCLSLWMAAWFLLRDLKKAYS